MMRVSMTLLCALVVLLSLATAAAGKNEYYRFVSVDVRKCAPPLCGGYFIEKVNVNDSKTYVAKIVYTDHSVESTVNKFRTAYSSAAIVFYGELVPTPPVPGVGYFNVKSLSVDTAYLGMPGQPGVSGLNFYTINATANSTSAKLLNSLNRAAPIKRSSVTPVNPTNNLDLPWQLNQILSNSAVVAGTITKAPHSLCPIFIKAVYIKLPVVAGPCPFYKIACDADKGGQVVYNRTVDLCFKPSCTYDPMMCIMSIPTCTDGYRLVGWSAPPGACNRYACDPIFAPKVSKLNF